MFGAFRAVQSAAYNPRLAQAFEVAHKCPIHIARIQIAFGSAAVAIADSDTSSKRMKHIATRLAFLRECIANKEIMMYHIRNTGQVADIFTKPLSAASFHVLRELLLGGN